MSNGPVPLINGCDEIVAHDVPKATAAVVTVDPATFWQRL